MKMVDVNVLIYAHREESERHKEFKTWLERTIRDEGIALTDLVLSGFLRVVTHPRILVPPSPTATAVAFVEQLRQHPACTIIHPGSRQWTVFLRLIRQAGCKGNLIADAFHAATAIDAGCEWITTDRDFARFPGLRWRHPLDEIDAAST